VVTGRPRAALLVANAAAPYSRGLRVGRTLVAAGWEVEIAAVADGQRASEERDGDVMIRRYAPSGRWAAWATGRPGLRGRLGSLGRLLDIAVKAVAWPVHVRGWWKTLRRELPPADLYHAFGILTVGVAIGLAADARRHGHPGARVVYDVIDVILESNNYASVPPPLLAFYRAREKRWVRRADAIVTVNEPIADYLERSWRLRERPTVMINAQPAWPASEPRPDLIRAATGLPRERRIVLFVGRLGRERGLDEAAEAVLQLDDAALVLLGFGPWADELRRRDADPRFAGRHVTLPPVHPDEVPAWTASADVSVIAVPANSLNQRLSTPNKFWESLTAGTPVVVGRDLEVMRAIVEADDLGAIADPSDPADLARALGEVLDRGPGDYAALRQRCIRVTRDRYNWETASKPYLALVERLRGSAVPPPVMSPGP
jgi:glycosyltransferase involved in cell wall biosynthesis